MTSTPQEWQFNTNTSSTSRQASLQLSFIIVGGNIGGLSCAYALASAGHHVRVLERLKRDDPTSFSGVRVPPNLSRILIEWGLEEELREKSLPNVGTMFSDMDTGEFMACARWTNEVMQEAGGDFRLMHHRDLYNMLYRVAMRVGAEILYGSDVVQVVPGTPEKDRSEQSFNNESTHSLSGSIVNCTDSSVSSMTSYAGFGSPSVFLANGEVLYADIIVGADGCNSLVRDVILQDDDNHGRNRGMNIFSTTFTREQMESDPDLLRLISGHTWDYWMGSGETFMGYAINNRREYAIHAFWPHHHVLDDDEHIDAQNWTSKRPTEKLAQRLKMDHCNPVLQKLAQLPSRISRANYFEFPRMEQWAHSSGTIVIMGHAAYPDLPCTIHSTAGVVEDAAVFGGLFSRLRSWDQIPSLMEAFHDLRKDRRELLNMRDHANIRLTTMMPGPARDARNESMRQNSYLRPDEWKGAILREQWNGLSKTFWYNAVDAAADWWAGWGVLGDMAKKRTIDRVEVSFSVIPSHLEP